MRSFREGPSGPVLALFLLFGALSAGLSPGVSAAAGDELRLLRTLPATVWAEPDPRGWRLNFDVLLENAGAGVVEISFLELEAFDAEGRLVLRRHMGAGGFPGAIEQLPQRLVPPRGRLHLFNPFERLPADLDFETLRLGIYHAGGRLQETLTPRRDVPFVLPVLPLGGEVFVEAAGDLNAPHRRIALTDPRQPVLGRTRNSERFALDLTYVDGSGSYREGPREMPSSWFAWDREVRAPVAGRVISVRDSVPDNRLLADGGIERAEAERAPFDAHLGNYVVLELAPEVHLVLAHLRRGSVAVAAGDAVWPGALLGRVGVSGAASYPHLHTQLQRGSAVLDSEPLPVAFACVDDRGGGRRRPAWLATGDLVRPCRIGRDD